MFWTMYALGQVASFFYFTFLFEHEDFTLKTFSFQKKKNYLKCALISVIIYPWISSLNKWSNIGRNSSFYKIFLCLDEPQIFTTFG